MTDIAIARGQDATMLAQARSTRQTAANERAGRITAAEEQLQAASLSPEEAAQHQSYYNQALTDVDRLRRPVNFPDLPQMAAKQRAQFNPSSEATALYNAMKGGLWGAGTDEEALFKALEGKNQEQIDAIKMSYRDHYGQELESHLKEELSGSELTRAQGLLAGDRIGADADALFAAMDGMGTDEKAIYRTLEGKDEKQRAALTEAYRSRHGSDLAGELKKELSGDSLKRAESLLTGNGARAEAARLHEAMAGMGTDEQTIFQSLAGKNPEERAAIEKAYRQEYGTALGADLGSELSGSDLTRADSLLAGNRAGADAAALHTAMEDWGTDEEAVMRTLEGKTDRERDTIRSEYRRLYGTDLEAGLKEEMGGSDLEISQSLLSRGKLTDAQRLHRAMDGAGTDEKTIKNVLHGRTKEEIAAIREDYRNRYGAELKDDLTGDLSGRDEFDAFQELKGKPQTTEEAMQRMKERYDFERTGIRNLMGRRFVDSLSDKGKLVDGNYSRAQQEYLRSMADGKLDDGEQKRIAELTGYVTDDVDTYRAAKDSAAEGAATVAATAASVAVVVGTAGTATPLVVGTAAAFTGGATRMATKGIIEGQGYGWEDGAADFATGAADGAANVVGMKAGTVAAQGLLRSQASSLLRRGGFETSERLIELTGREMLVRQTATRILAGSVEGAVGGATGGGLSGTISSAVRDGTWDDGFGAGMARVAGGTAAGAGMGAVAGGVISGALAAHNAPLHLTDESRIWLDQSMPGNKWRDYGSYNDMVTVNRALEPLDNVPSVRIAGSDGSVRDITVYNTHNAREVENVRQAVQRLHDVGADEALQTLDEIHIRDIIGQGLDQQGHPTSSISGLGGNNDGTIVLSRSTITPQASMMTTDPSWTVIHHELGHNLDRRMGAQNGMNWLSEAADSPFGKGASVSAYGSRNAVEDFAETHAALIADWDNIMANPDRYVHYNGDVGKKFKWMLEHIYHRDVAAPTPLQSRFLDIQGTGGTTSRISMQGVMNNEEAEALRKSFQHLHDIGIDESVLQARQIHIGAAEGQGDGVLAISRQSLETFDQGAGEIYRSVSRDLDRRLGEQAGLSHISLSPDSPFGKGASAVTFGGRTLSAADDFAATNEMLIKSWDMIMANPDAAIYQNQTFGDKYRWLLEKVYHQQLPPPGSGGTGTLAQSAVLGGFGVMGTGAAGGTTDYNTMAAAMRRMGIHNRPDALRNMPEELRNAILNPPPAT